MYKTKNPAWKKTTWLVWLWCCVTPVTPILAADADLAPDFTLKAGDGRNIRLHELRGNVVMINFWATWCRPCREELPELEQLYNKYRKTGFVFLGINVDDDRANALNMMRQLGLNFTVLFDDNKKVSELYNVDAMPLTMLIDRDGKSRYLSRGYRPGNEEKYQVELRKLLME